MTLMAHAVTAITPSPAPVLFLGSCVVLDVVRAPLAERRRRGSRCLLVARRGPQGAADGLPGRRLPAPPEWSDHVDEAVQDCTTAVNSYCPRACRNVIKAHAWREAGSSPPAWIRSG